MDVKKPVERDTESRLQAKFAVAAGVLAIVACGAAELASAQAADPVPKVSAVVLPETGKPLGAPAPASESVTKTAKPASVAKKPESQKRKTASQKRKTAAMQKSKAGAKPAGDAKPVARAKRAVKSKPAVKPRHVATPVQVAQLDRKLDAQSTDQQVAPQPRDVLLEPAYPQVEPVTPAPERASPLMSVEPVPSPAPTGSEPVSPVEPVPVAPAAPVSVPPVEPALGHSVIVPKYNDIMTAVLRSDLQAAKELLDLGWWVDKPSTSGITPLMAAVMNRDAPMVQLLLDYGAEPTAKALELARKNKDTATATLLENKGAR